MGAELVVQERKKVPSLSQCYYPPPPQPHSNLESRDLGDRARGWVGDSEIAPRSGAEWVVPAGRADPRQRSPRPRDKCTALPDSMGSLDKSEGVLFGAWQTR